MAASRDGGRSGGNRGKMVYHAFMGSAFTGSRRGIGRGLWLLALVLPVLMGVERLPPIRVDILGPSGEVKGKALVFPNYVQIQDASSKARGAIGVLLVEGQMRLFLVRSNSERSYIGWGNNHKLFDAKNKLIGYYNWTPIWSYVYDTKMKKVGQAQCIAYQGVCAAGVAGFLLGLY